MLLTLLVGCGDDYRPDCGLAPPNLFVRVIDAAEKTPVPSASIAFATNANPNPLCKQSLPNGGGCITYELYLIGMDTLIVSKPGYEAAMLPVDGGRKPIANCPDFYANSDVEVTAALKKAP